MNLRSPLSIFFLFHFLLFSGDVSAESFDRWKKNYAKRAAKAGLKQSFVLKILKQVELNQEVIKKDRKQVILNSDVDYQRFIRRWLRDDDARLSRAKKALKENRKLLEKIERKYQVDKEIIVTLWGVETFFGDITGNYNVVRSLATLAYEGRRRKFYEVQLNEALRLIKNGHVSYQDFKGSWAGATGQCQFMPSNIPAYGQDFNQDGKIDIWNTKADVFASIANLLKKSGWKRNYSVGSLALNTKGFAGDLNKFRTQAEYNKLGFRSLDRKLIRNKNWRARQASSIPMKNSPVVLRGSNYDPLLRWNRSSLFVAMNILILNSLD